MMIYSANYVCAFRDPQADASDAFLLFEITYR